MASETAFPQHHAGTVSATPPKYTTVATFPAGSFLENLAVRADGTVLVADMLSGCVWYVDPLSDKPQESVRLVHQFQLENQPEHQNLKEEPQSGGHVVGQTHSKSESESEGEGHGHGHGHAMYASTPAAEAIIRGPSADSDVFYIASGIHGRAGTWWLYELDMNSFSPSRSSSGTTTTHSTNGAAKITPLAPIPEAKWLNGGTAIPSPTNPLILLAESFQGRIYAYDIARREVSVWLEHALLGKVTSRPPWPGLNGIQFHQDSTGEAQRQKWVYFTNSDRAIFGRVRIQQQGDKAIAVPDATDSGDTAVEILATSCAGDDFCLNAQGHAYVSTNPMNTVLKLHAADLATSAFVPALLPSTTGGIDHSYGMKHDPARTIILGAGLNASNNDMVVDENTTGPTAVAFATHGGGKGGSGDLFVVTNGGIINPLDGVVREARLLRVEMER